MTVATQPLTDDEIVSPVHFIATLGEPLRAPGVPPAWWRSPLRVPRSAACDDVERAHIRRVLEGCGWKIDGKGHAAEKLGLHPSTLRPRMRKARDLATGAFRVGPARTAVSVLIPLR